MDQMGAAYPDLVRAGTLITETLKLEETRFKKTLDRGLGLLDTATEGIDEGGVLDGETAFKLYDTYGFPLDLTEDALRGMGMTVDNDGFDVAMDRQRAEARKAWSGSGDAATEEIWFKIREDLGATEFLGYEAEQAEAQVLALVVGGNRTDIAKAGDEACVIVNQTPFYGEAGGQVGDTGTIAASDGVVFTVTDTQKHVNNLYVHVGRLDEGELKAGDEVRLEVDGDRRRRVRANHSATHLLHEALRRRLGDHVTQKGSLVAPDRLRFDISHPKPLEADEITAVEAEVNRQIGLKKEVVTRLMEPDAAVEAGAMALFGEKYGDEVRVVSMGGEEAVDTADAAFSTELCGGTHVRNTGDIGVFRILSESAVAAGVRRLEALTGDGAKEYQDQARQTLTATTALVGVKPEQLVQKVEELLGQRRDLERQLIDIRRQSATGAGGDQVAKAPSKPGAKPDKTANPEHALADTAALLKVQAQDVPERVGALIEEVRTLESDIKKIRDKIASGDGGDAEIKDVGGISYQPRLLDAMPAKELKSLADELKAQMGSGVIALVSVNDGKASVVVGVTDDLTERASAVDLVRIGSAAVGGKGGGGRPDMAQAGGPDGTKGQAALDAIEAAIAEVG